MCLKIFKTKKWNSIKELLNAAVQVLEKANIDDAKQNVNQMASKALNISYTQLPLHWQKPVSDNFLKDLDSMINRRLAYEPLQYILGEWCFLDFDVNVGEGALIPRPETEEVFLAAVEAIKNNIQKQDFKFADVGTGTGILGLAMAKYFPKSIGYLVDVSDKALEIAKSNLLKYSELLVRSNDKNNFYSNRHCELLKEAWQSRNLNDLNNSRLSLIKSDLLEAFKSDSLDVIISNPPYIDSEEVKSLMPEVVDYEPHLALDGGRNGLELIDKLLKQAEIVLRNKGLFIFEHGHGQRNEIKRLLSSCWEILKEGNDFADKERFFILKLLK
ncbi:MAG: peptide chain release factor N(5)-glutamine methyltransferase [Candidatus Riflebacteria bacterium]|nr:peptide chain release factor N(5)-glutamine methyltransferase [Candidatus Riflebacteria bacterium]